MDQYGQVGVDYDVLDESKRAAIDAAQATSALIGAHGGEVLEASRGASAFVLRLGDQTLAFVVEGLGTKSIVARQWLEASGEDRFADVGVDGGAASAEEAAMHVVGETEADRALQRDVTDVPPLGRS